MYGLFPLILFFLGTINNSFGGDYFDGPDDFAVFKSETLSKKGVILRVRNLIEDLRSTISDNKNHNASSSVIIELTNLLLDKISNLIKEMCQNSENDLESCNTLKKESMEFSICTVMIGKLLQKLKEIHTLDDISRIIIDQLKEINNHLIPLVNLEVLNREGDFEIRSILEHNSASVEELNNRWIYLGKLRKQFNKIECHLLESDHLRKIDSITDVEEVLANNLLIPKANYFLYKAVRSLKDSYFPQQAYKVATLMRTCGSDGIGVIQRFCKNVFREFCFKADDAYNCLVNKMGEYAIDVVSECPSYFATPLVNYCENDECEPPSAMENDNCNRFRTECWLPVQQAFGLSPVCSPRFPVKLHLNSSQ